MRKQIVSLFLVLSLVLVWMPSSAYAASDHTYYSQYNHYDNEGKALGNSLCYVTALAMIITDLGKTVTPVDVYYANGERASVYPYDLAKAYGLTYSPISLEGKSAAEKKQTIINELTSGKYPAGFVVRTVVNGEQHYVVARKAVNGDVLFDCPANGCCISLGKTGHQPSWSQITHYNTFVPNNSWESANGTGSGTQGTGSQSPTVESGSWTVTVPANYKLLCYDSAAAASSNGIYVRPQTSAYTITCTQKATLPNGTVRYYAAFNNGKNHYWFVFSNGMSAYGSTDNKTQPAAYTITFNALTTPGNLTVGNGGHIDGSITSSGSPITSVKAEVYASATGEVVMTASSSGFSVSTYGPIKNSKIDADLKFGTLPAGTYYIKYTATTADGTIDWAVTSTFSITASAGSSNSTSTVSGKWTVTIPANYKLNCYSSYSASSNSTYISAKSSSYNIYCTQKVTLSNGKIRYFFVSGDNKSLWFDFTSSMTAVGG